MFCHHVTSVLLAPVSRFNLEPVLKYKGLVLWVCIFILFILLSCLLEARGVYMGLSWFAETSSKWAPPFGVIRFIHFTRWAHHELLVFGRGFLILGPRF